MKKYHKLIGFLKRYMIVHVLVYLIVGLVFMYLMNYREAFETYDHFSNYRSLDSPIVRAAVLFQILRAFMIALILYPFRERIIKSQWGWLMLFSLFFGLTCLGAINASPGSIEGMIYTKMSLEEHLVGYPEVIVQSFGISWFFWKWERTKL
jgi:hypothetical protein